MPLILAIKKDITREADFQCTPTATFDEGYLRYTWQKTRSRTTGAQIIIIAQID